MVDIFNSLAPRRFEWNFRWVIFKLISMIDGWDILCEIVHWWISFDITDDKSTLARVMALYRQATSQYLSQCWYRSMSQYGVTRPQWVNEKHVCQILMLTIDRDYLHSVPCPTWRHPVNYLHKTLVYERISLQPKADIDFHVIWNHDNDVKMGAIASQITSLTIVDSTVYSDANQRKHQSSSSLAFYNGGIQRDGLECLMMLIEVINKGSVPYCGSNGYNSTGLYIT